MVYADTCHEPTRDPGNLGSGAALQLPENPGEEFLSIFHWSLTGLLRVVGIPTNWSHVTRRDSRDGREKRERRL